MLEFAEGLARRHFPHLALQGFRRVWDPETGDEWVVLTVRLSGDIDVALDQCDEWSLAWHERVSGPARHLIALSTEPG